MVDQHDYADRPALRIFVAAGAKVLAVIRDVDRQQDLQAIGGIDGLVVVDNLAEALAVASSSDHLQALIIDGRPAANHGGMEASFQAQMDFYNVVVTRTAGPVVIMVETDNPPDRLDPWRMGQVVYPGTITYLGWQDVAIARQFMSA